MTTDSWSSVRRGISLVYYGLVVAVVTVSLLFLNGLMGPTGWGRILPVLMLAAGVMSLVGKLYCLGVPEKTGTKEIILAAVGLDIAGTVLGLARYVAVVPPFVGAVGSLMALVAPVLFLVFLMRLAESINQPALSEQAASVLRIGIGGIITWLLAFVGTLVFPPLALVIIIALPLMLIGFIRYVSLLGRMKAALVPRRRTRKRAVSNTVSSQAGSIA